MRQIWYVLMRVQGTGNNTAGQIFLVFFLLYFCGCSVITHIMFTVEHTIILCLCANLQLMKLPDKDIVEMVFFPVVNEACRVLDEGIAVKASDLDIASIMGMGFPPYRFLFWSALELIEKFILTLPMSFLVLYKKPRGGIMFWADTLGANYIFERLEAWSKMYGDFFKPCSYLTERATKGIPLVSRFQPFSKI